MSKIDDIGANTCLIVSTGLPALKHLHSVDRMHKDEIKQLITARTHQDGLTETGIPGVRLFRATHAIPCAPAVYEPSVVVIVSGTKEAVLDGRRYIYDSRRYLCCPIVHARASRNT